MSIVPELVMADNSQLSMVTSELQETIFPAADRMTIQ
jgi:hypothetical protein